MKAKGFTLLEVLVALSVFTVGMLAVVTLGSQSQLLTKTSLVRTRAALLSQEGIETAVAEGYAQLPAGDLFLDEPTLDYIGADFAGYARQVSIEYVDSEMNIAINDTGMLLITSTVTWDDTTGDESNIDKTFTATTILTDL